MEKKSEMLVTPFASASKQKAMSHKNTYSHSPPCSLCSLPAGCRRRQDRKDRLDGKRHIVI
jgi:hypothetical protein